ncbi:MAG: HD domain-containing protein [Candidatus Thorarchaeota archaeon]|nr:HD domain-containing protein [Candidatus Thorarchaeota archaeon]
MYHDPIHGTGRGFETIESRLIHCAEVQRLRHIKQLSTVYIPYPNANHTRYEHVLGTTHLVKVILRRLLYQSGEGVQIALHDVLQASVAAILHDIGHSALGHGLEKFAHLIKNNKLRDKNVSKMLLEGKIGIQHHSVPCAADILESLKKDPQYGDLFEPKDIAKIINGFHHNPKKLFIANLISGAIDADRMDYLLRDAYHTIPGGQYDFGGIIENMAVREIRDSEDCVLAFYERGIPSLESLVTSRDFMYTQVYHNRINRISQAMIARALYKEQKSLGSPLEDIWLKTDNELLTALAETDEKGIACHIARKIIECRPYYVIPELCWRYDYLTSDSRKEIALMNQNPQRLLEFEEELAQAVSLKDGSVIVDILPDPKTRESSAVIIPTQEGELVDLKKKSKLVNYMTSMEYLTARSEIVVGIDIDDLDVLHYLRSPSEDESKRISKIRKAIEARIELKEVLD